MCVICNLISEAKAGNPNSMLELLNKFKPLIGKYLFLQRPPYHQILRMEGGVVEMIGPKALVMNYSRVYYLSARFLLI